MFKGGWWYGTIDDREHEIGDTPMSNAIEEFSGFAIIELMGRNVIAGYVTTQVIAGVAMLRVDVPAVDDKPGFSKFISGQAIYGITPTDEETVKTAANNLRTRPIELWIVPDRKALPIHAVEAGNNDPYPGEFNEDDYDDDDEFDRPGF